VTRQVNESGWAVTTYRMDERPGPNILKFEPLTSVPDIKRTIMGVANGIPFYIILEVFPFDYVAADGEHFFPFSIRLKINSITVYRLQPLR